KKADTKRYTIYYPSKDFIDHNIFITIRDSQTTFIKPYQKDLNINQGLMLDIMPLDGCPSSKIKRKIQKMWAMIYSLYCAQLVVENHGKGMNLISKIMLKVVPGKTLKYKIWHMAEKKMTKYKIKDCEKITELCAGPHYMQKEYPKAVFQSAVYKSFEGYDCPVPVGYDVYLKTAFGDYMKMPPKEKQIAHHDVVFFDLENGYENYRGKYFCQNK
ncbi:MAG: LicD family protein, partial [Oscillospiraceae bacterium]